MTCSEREVALTANNEQMSRLFAAANAREVSDWDAWCQEMRERNF
jgi:hypothetical protein